MAAVMTMKLSSTHHSGSPLAHPSQKKRAKCAAIMNWCWSFSSLHVCCA